MKNINRIKSIIILSLFWLLIAGCNNISKAKYMKGDIVYLKPNCQKGVVWDINRTGYMYSISIDPKDITCVAVDEEQIYGKECPK